MRKRKSARRAQLFALSVAITAAAGLGSAWSQAKPNVILMNLDDVAWGMVQPYIDHLSAESKLDNDPSNDIENDYFGFPIVQPGIQELADDGVLMTNGYSSSPVCWPSRTGLLSGQTPIRWANGNKVPNRYDTIAEYLKDAGYATKCIGKWQGLEGWYKDGGLQTSKDVDQHPLNRGFDEFYGFTWGSHSYYELEISGDVNNASPELNHVYNDWDIATAADNLSDGVYGLADPESHPNPWYITHEFTAQALDFIQRKKSQPFFIYMPYHARHTPDQIPDTYGPYVSDKHRTSRMVDAVDEGLSEIIQLLKDENLYNNTIIIFTSDNGGPSFFNAGPSSANNPGLLRGRKSNLYEGGIRVPYLVSWPAQLPAGSVLDMPVSNIDFLPTLLAAANITTADEFDGADILPQLKGNVTTDPHEELFWGINNVSTTGQIAVRAGDWKYLNYRDELQLYDLSVDPLESNNLINVETTVAAQMQARVDAFMEEVFGESGDPDDPDPTETAIYTEDFATGSGFTLVTTTSVGGNSVGEMTVPASGSSTAKDVLSAPLVLDGDTTLGLAAKLQLPAALQGSPTFSLRVTFATASGNTIVNGDTVTLDGAYVGQFVDYSDTINVPAGATDVVDVRLRVGQANAGSATQAIYFDDIELLSFVGEDANEAPAVTITAPADGAQFAAGTPILVTVSAQDSDGSVSGVEVIVDGEPEGQDSEAPYEFTLTNLTVGAHEVEVIATDDQGAIAVDTINIGVTPTKDLGVRIEAESFDGQSGLGIFGNGTKIGAIHSGDWARYDAFDFEGGATSVEIALASNNQGGTVEFRLDSVTGQLLGSATITGTGSWNTFVTVTEDLDVIPTGVHDLFLVFSGGTQALLDVDWFKFVAPNTTVFYDEDFETPHGFTNTAGVTLGGNGVGQLTVPASGNVTAKDDLGGPTNTIPLNGATHVTVETALQLAAPEAGFLQARMVVQFVDSSGGTVSVNGDYLELSDSFVGGFLTYQDDLVVPVGAVSIDDVRVRVNQNVSGSAVQTLYIDDVKIIDDPSQP